MPRSWHSFANIVTNTCLLGTVNHMSILDVPIASFTRSDLRRPEVVETAQRGPVKIRNADGDLVLVAQTEVDRARELRSEAHNFLRVLVEVRRSAPSPVILGDVSFVADWSAEDRERFMEGYAEALDLSLRDNDITPLRLFIKTMRAPERRTDRPDFDGRIDPSAHNRIAARLSS